MRRHLIPLILLILAVIASPNLILNASGMVSNTNAVPMEATALADACPNAPTPRLRIGMSAVVSNGIDRLNLRALPAVSTGIEVQLYAGNGLTVLSGPSCNGHFNWWRVETVNGRRGWVAEGTWEVFYVVPTDRPTAAPLEWSCLERFGTRKCVVA